MKGFLLSLVSMTLLFSAQTKAITLGGLEKKCKQAVRSNDKSQKLSRLELEIAAGCFNYIDGYISALHFANQVRLARAKGAKMNSYMSCSFRERNQMLTLVKMVMQYANQYPKERADNASFSVGMAFLPVMECKANNI